MRPLQEHEKATAGRSLSSSSADISLLILCWVPNKANRPIPQVIIKPATEVRPNNISLRKDLLPAAMSVIFKCLDSDGKDLSDRRGSYSACRGRFQTCPYVKSYVRQMVSIPQPGPVSSLPLAA